jgi:hypothetical protein
LPLGALGNGPPCILHVPVGHRWRLARLPFACSRSARFRAVHDQMTGLILRPASHPFHAVAVGLASWAAVAHRTRGVLDQARSGTMEYAEKVRSQFHSPRHNILKYNVNSCFSAADPKASVIRSEIRSRAKLNCALPLFLHLHTNEIPRTDPLV